MDIRFSILFTALVLGLSSQAMAVKDVAVPEDICSAGLGSLSADRVYTGLNSLQIVSTEVFEKSLRGSLYYTQRFQEPGLLFSQPLDTSNPSRPKFNLFRAVPELWTSYTVNLGSWSANRKSMGWGVGASNYTNPHDQLLFGVKNGTKKALAVINTRKIQGDEVGLKDVKFLELNAEVNLENGLTFAENEVVAVGDRITVFEVKPSGKINRYESEVLPGGNQFVRASAITKFGNNYLIAIGHDIFRFEAVDGTLLKTDQVRLFGKSFKTVLAVQDGELVAAVDLDGKIIIFNMKSGRQHSVLGTIDIDGVSPERLASYKNFLLIGDVEKGVWISDITNGLNRKIYSGPLSRFEINDGVLEVHRVSSPLEPRDTRQTVITKISLP